PPLPPDDHRYGQRLRRVDLAASVEEDGAAPTCARPRSPPLRSGNCRGRSRNDSAHHDAASPAMLPLAGRRGPLPLGANLLAAPDRRAEGARHPLPGCRTDGLVLAAGSLGSREDLRLAVEK